MAATKERDGRTRWNTVPQGKNLHPRRSGSPNETPAGDARGNRRTFQQEKDPAPNRKMVLLGDPEQRLDRVRQNMRSLSKDQNIDPETIRNAQPDRTTE